MSPSAADDLLSVAEAAQLLGIDQTTVRGLIRRHGLPAHRVGRGLKLRRLDLEAWVEGRRVQPGDLEG